MPRVKPNCPIIAIEEHYLDKELALHPATMEREPNLLLTDKLLDLGALRLRDMDEAGVDVQVLSHATASAEGPESVELTKRVNERLAEFCAANSARFSAFASLPVAEPESAADELERVVTQHRFVGAMVHGLSKGEFLDHKKFWPIFERAEKLDVPIYLHPAVPHANVIDAYYKEYVSDFPMLTRAAWGFTVEAATQAIRLVLSGVFDKHPNLKIILGHLGETLPYLVWRIDLALARPGGRSIKFRDAFCTHFYVTTSGNFSNPALLCCVQEMGVDRILFAIDWPYVPNKLGTDWIEQIPLCEEDKVKILSGNAKRLLRI